MSEDACVIIWDGNTGRWLCIQDRWGKYDITSAVKEGLRNAKKDYGRFPESEFYISFIIYEMIKNRNDGCGQIRVGILERYQTWDSITEKFDSIGGKDVYSEEGEILLILNEGDIRIKDWEGNYILKETSFEDFIN